MEMQKSYWFSIAKNIKQLVICVRPVFKVFARLYLIYPRMMRMKKGSDKPQDGFLVFSFIRLKSNFHVYSDATMRFSSTPMPSTSQRTTSPTAKYCGVWAAKPTPAGVPVRMTVPGVSVMPRERSLMM